MHVVYFDLNSKNLVHHYGVAEILGGRKYANRISTKIERRVFLCSFRDRYSNAFYEFSILDISKPWPLTEKLVTN